MTATSADEAIATIANWDDETPERRERARDYWMIRMVRALWGTLDRDVDEDDRRPGLLEEFRNFRRLFVRGAAIGGSATIVLQIVQTFSLAGPIKTLLVHVFGGH